MPESREERRKKQCEKQQCEHRGQRRRGRRCSRQSRGSPPACGRDHGGDGLSLQPTDESTLEQIATLPLWEDPGWSSWAFPEGTLAGGEPMLEQGKSVGRKELQRGAVMD